MQVRLEDDVRQDLRDVMAWITTESGASIAASIINNILSSLEILADHPYIAEAYQIVPFRRMITDAGHQASYRVDESNGVVMVDRFFHYRQHQPTKDDLKNA